MKTYTIRFAKAPSYRKVYKTEIEAADKWQAIAKLNKQELSRGAGGRHQIIEISEKK